MFKGFLPETISFLINLKENNNKAWFEANKTNYQKFLLKPLHELVIELSPFMLSIDPLFEVNPKKAVSRINRDIRFSHDKSPYRANMWIAFKRIYLDWKVEPTYFFEILPDYYRYGMGFYNIPRETMNKIRAMIDSDNKEFQKVNSLYKKQEIFVLEGEKYKKTLKPNLSADLNEWYQRKELYFVCNKKIDERLYGPILVDDLIEGFKLLAPIYRFFIELKKGGFYE